MPCFIFMPNTWVSLSLLPASVWQSVGVKLSKPWTFQTLSLSKLANSTARVMRCSLLTYIVCLDLSCLLCINLHPAAGWEVTERRIGTSSAVWRMMAAIPPGHGDGTTSIQPLRSLKCRAFWLCQHCSAQHCSNSPDHCQKPRRKSPENRRRKRWCYWSQTGGAGYQLITANYSLSTPL